MKKLLVSLFLLTQAVCAETYVHPLRADLGIEDKTAMMPYETYTGTTSWATGKLSTNTLIDFSHARNNMWLVDANCVVLDGVAVFNSGISYTSFNDDLAIDITFKDDGTETYYGIFAHGKTAGSAGISKDANNYIFGIRGDSALMASVHISSLHGKWIHAVGSYTASTRTVTLSITDLATGSVLTDTNTASSAMTGTPDVSTFKVSNNMMSGWPYVTFKGEIANIQLEIAGTEVAHYTFSGGLGMGLDEPDVSGNGNDGTWSTDDVASLRSGKQDVFHYNFMEGCSVISNKYVPADQWNGGYDTDGNLLTNPRGYAHNNSESSIVIGATTNSYANLLTNSVNIVTNSAGLITEFYE